MTNAFQEIINLIYFAFERRILKYILIDFIYTVCTV